MYEMNKTMMLLGQQGYDRVFAYEGASNGLIDILKAMQTKNPFLSLDDLLDAYTWGFIIGQRSERARKNRHKAG